MSKDNATKVYEQTVLDLRNLVLFGTPFKEGDFKTSPIVRPDIWNNNPRFSIVTNNPKEAEMTGRWGGPLSKERFQIGLSPLVMLMILDHIEKIAKGELKVNRRVLRTRGYRDGKSKANGDKPEVTSTIAYGRNEKGQVYMQFKWWNRDACEVVFKDDFWHELEDIGELEAPDKRQKLADEITAKWASLLADIYRRLVFHKFEQNNFTPKQKGPSTSTPKSDTPEVKTELPATDNKFDEDVDW